MTTTADSGETRVLVLAPTGRDAVLVRAVLERSRIDCKICSDLTELRREVVRGAGTVILTEEGLHDRPALGELVQVVHKQRPWSHLPFLVFTSRRAESVSREVRKLGEIGDVTLLDRPIRKITLVSAVRSTLRSRRRQFQVRDLVEELERAVRHRDRFLAILGHELRNPLSAISTAVQVMDQRDSVAHSRERAVIHRQTRLLSRLVDDLLDVSRVTSGKVVLRRVPVDLGELTERAVRAFSPAAAKEGVSVGLRREPKPVFVEGDPDRLDQIISNLLANAIKYTPPDGHVEVVLRAVGEEAEVQVADTGVGIEPEILPRVFDLFTQADSTLDRSQGGLGIGLTLVKSLVELHGGNILGESAGRGQGSTFTVRLARTDVGEAAASAEASSDEAARPVIPRRILVIEDNDDVREGLRMLLEDLGHQIYVAEDGEDGVAKAIAEAPDAVLIDIGLPRVDGYVAARRIRQALGDQIHLIALTGYGLPEDRLRVTDAGFNNHLVKPTTLAAIERILNDGAGTNPGPEPRGQSPGSAGRTSNQEKGDSL